MKKFIVIYHAPAEAMAQMASATPEQKEEGMKGWLAWKDSIGNGLLDFGAPLVGGQRILPDGTTKPSAKEVSGYSIIQAEDLDKAKRLLKNHPHLQWTGGCDIEVHECVPM
ncbi:MAG: YciI family protein [bacterium]|nr:YciI family protein [bacterium]